MAIEIKKYYRKNHKKTALIGRIVEVNDALVRILKKKCGTNANVSVLEEENNSIKQDIEIEELGDPMLSKLNNPMIKVEINGHHAF